MFLFCILYVFIMFYILQMTEGMFSRNISDFTES